MFAGEVLRSHRMKYGGPYLFFSMETASEGECKYLEVSYGHLKATVRSNARLR